MIYQHFRLVNNFTVAENIVLGAKSRRIINRQESMELKVQELSERFDWELIPLHGSATYRWRATAGGNTENALSRL